MGLPTLAPEVIDMWRDVLEDVCEDADCDDVVTVSHVLALCGWRLGKQDEVMEDLYSTRHVGLWNFLSLLEEEDMKESQKILREFSENVEVVRSNDVDPGHQAGEKGDDEKGEGDDEKEEDLKKTSDNSGDESEGEVEMKSVKPMKPYFHPLKEHMS